MNFHQSLHISGGSSKVSMNHLAIISRINLDLPIINVLVLLQTVPVILLIDDLHLLYLELIDASFGFEHLLLLDDVVLFAHLSESRLVLVANVHVDAHFTCIFGLETESVHDVGLAVLVQVLSPDELFKFEDSDRAAQEEGMDLSCD